MTFYTDMVEGLKKMIGPGKKYANPTQMAKACGVAPNQIIRYIRQERGKHIQVIAKVLDEVGARIIFPDTQDSNLDDCYCRLPELLARPDVDGERLVSGGETSAFSSFSRKWLQRKGSLEYMGVLTVTGNSMGPRLEEGDRVIVDQSQRELFEGRIYAMRIDRDIIIRRIAKEPGRILLVSDNPEAEPRKIGLEIGEESKGWATMGRVIYVAKDLP